MRAAMEVASVIQALQGLKPLLVAVSDVAAEATTHKARFPHQTHQTRETFLKNAVRDRY
jgi:hypothetical protein